MRAIKAVTIRARTLGKVLETERRRETREDSSLAIINGRFCDLFFGRQGSENSLGATRIVKSDRSRTVGAGYVRQHTHIGCKRTTKRNQLERDERTPHQQKHKAVGQ